MYSVYCKLLRIHCIHCNTLHKATLSYTSLFSTVFGVLSPILFSVPYCTVLHCTVQYYVQCVKSHSGSFGGFTILHCYVQYCVRCIEFCLSFGGQNQATQQQLLCGGGKECELDGGRLVVGWRVDLGKWTLNSGHRAMDIGQGTSDSGHRTVDIRQWTSDNGHRTMDIGYWTLDRGHQPWTSDSGHWTLDNE